MTIPFMWVRDDETKLMESLQTAQIVQPTKGSHNTHKHLAPSLESLTPPLTVFLLAAKRKISHVETSLSESFCEYRFLHDLCLELTNNLLKLFTLNHLTSLYLSFGLLTPTLTKTTTLRAARKWCTSTRCNSRLSPFATNSQMGMTNRLLSAKPY